MVGGASRTDQSDQLSHFLVLVTLVFQRLYAGLMNLVSLGRSFLMDRGPFLVVAVNKLHSYSCH